MEAGPPSRAESDDLGGFRRTDGRNAFLVRADLTGAWLDRANLTGAQLGAESHMSWTPPGGCSAPRLWGRGGTSRVRDATVAGPALIRRLDVGQAAYIYRGSSVTFVQVKRLIAAPPALPREPVPAAEPAPGPMTAARSLGDAPTGGTDRPASLPDAGPLLDEAFGGEPG